MEKIDSGYLLISLHNYKWASKRVCNRIYWEQIYPKNTSFSGLCLRFQHARSVIYIQNNWQCWLRWSISKHVYATFTMAQLYMTKHLFQPVKYFTKYNTKCTMTEIENNEKIKMYPLPLFPSIPKRGQLCVNNKIWFVVHFFFQCTGMIF